MGSFMEFNDTLQITTEQGFPHSILNLEKHHQNSIFLADVAEKIFEFQNKPGARIFHPAPTRCFLVQNIGEKWVYWGKIIILEQTIAGDKPENQTTSGKYKIINLYDPKYQEDITKHESPDGLSYF